MGNNPDTGKFKFPLDLGAPVGSLEGRSPAVDNGLDIPDPSRYYSREFMEKEWQHLWPRVWLIAAVTADIREPGDFTVFEHGHEEFIVVRQDDGSIKAFYNVCSHRGNRVCQVDRGTASSFTCAFHSWEFGCNGTLNKIVDEETFNKKLVGHRPGLTEVRCETLAGIVFINMDGNAPPLKEWMGLPEGYLEAYDIENMNLVRHTRSEWKSNWKTGVDTFYESYHLPHVHPQTQGAIEEFSQIDLYKNGFGRMIMWFGIKSHRHPVEHERDLDEGVKVMLRDAGIDLATYSGTVADTRRDIQIAKRERAKRLGLSNYERLTDGQLSDGWITGLFPNVQIGMHAEGIFIMRFVPHPTDPDRFFYDNMLLYRHVDDPNYAVPAWMAMPDGIDVTGETRPDIERWSADESPGIGPVLIQDYDLVAHVQRGIKSRGFKGPLWGDQEARVRHFHREVDRYIKGEIPPANATEGTDR
ncbi:MAG: aromatic ring-hydroxylating dioxygenase subunit alpha [Rhodocyclaceae bacterium]|nr:aromatic ring-hydroxylating dioxygenase subunit alpha [Rhodocyclaceae bacterium]